MSKIILEICVDSVASAWNAFEGGANRIELCAALSEGGLTPNLGTFLQIKKMIPEGSPFSIFVMLRPRRGTDFAYSEDEILSILFDISEFKRHGADGFVFGALLSSGGIDRESCRKIVEAASPRPVTFHRAFDVLAGDPEDDLQTLVDLGFKRLLTSGREKTAPQGIENIRRWNEQYGAKIVIMPGAGINSGNLEQMKRETNCHEFHSSCKETSEIHMNSLIGDLERNPVTLVDNVKALVQILRV